MSDIVLRNGSAISTGISNAPLPAKTLKRTRNALAEISANLVVDEGRLEAGAFLASTAMNHLGTLTAVAEAVVQMHPAAAQGCSQILNAYGMGAADTIRRTLR